MKAVETSIKLLECSSCALGEDFPNKRDALESLPADLQIYVAEDNQKFKDEIQKWDLSKNEVNATAEPQFSSIGGKTSTVDIYSNSDFG